MALTCSSLAAADFCASLPLACVFLEALLALSEVVSAAALALPEARSCISCSSNTHCLHRDSPD